MCSPGWATEAQRRTTAAGSPERVKRSGINRERTSQPERSGVTSRFTGFFAPPVSQTSGATRRLWDTKAPPTFALPLRAFAGNSRGRLGCSSGSFRRNNPTRFYSPAKTMWAVMHPLFEGQGRRGRRRSRGRFLFEGSFRKARRGILRRLAPASGHGAGRESLRIN